MEINWYPGHMTKAKRKMQEDIKLVDVIIELVDARAPLSTRNPDLKEMGAGKARLVLMNKADLADETENKKWLCYFKAQGYSCLALDSRKRGALKNISAMVKEACREKIERDLKKGIKNRPVKAMVVGIPNVGKSTFINSYAGKASAKTGNKPGVTKGNQWIRLGNDVQMLDTPGVLWAKIDDREAGKRLAFIGSIRDEVLNTEELCLELIIFLKETYPGFIEKRYETDESGEAVELLYRIGEKRGCLLKGSEISTEKAALLIFDDFRSGKLGRITLEGVPEISSEDEKG